MNSCARFAGLGATLCYKELMKKDQLACIFLLLTYYLSGNKKKHALRILSYLYTPYERYIPCLGTRH